jgi:hypothetical protein
MNTNHNKGGILSDQEIELTSLCLQREVSSRNLDASFIMQRR